MCPASICIFHAPRSDEWVGAWWWWWVAAAAQTAVGVSDGSDWESETTTRRWWETNQGWAGSRQNKATTVWRAKQTRWQSMLCLYLVTAFNVRPFGFLCSWSNGLELAHRQSSRSDPLVWRYSSFIIEGRGPALNGTYVALAIGLPHLIASAYVSMANTLVLLIKVSSMVTVYRGHCRTHFFPAGDYLPVHHVHRNY